jgi:hypothetical protein
LKLSGSAALAPNAGSSAGSYSRSQPASYLSYLPHAQSISSTSTKAPPLGALGLHPSRSWSLRIQLSSNSRAVVQKTLKKALSHGIIGYVQLLTLQ